MKEILLAIWLTVLGIVHADISTCPCSVDSNKFLTCDPGTILNFPNDVQLEPCSINPEEVVAIQLYDQPLYELQSRAFEEFPNLLQLMLSFNKITSIAHNAFDGLTKLNGLFLTGNNITQFERGTFDDLVSLKNIDVSDNYYLNPTYVTSAWHMCHREENDLQKGNLVFFKDLQMSQSTDLYCDHLRNKQDYSGMCNEIGTTLDCTGLEKIEDSICFVKHWAEGTPDSLTHILFDFPLDHVPIEVENYYEGASNKFFQDFNSFQEPFASNLTANQIVKNLTFYKPIFDLSELPRLTSRKTKKVTIWADTIYISAPITISHKTVIRARKVSINHKITMNITKDQLFDDTQDVEFWAMKEEYTIIKNVTMRQRMFGLFEILDEASNTQFISNEKCNALPKDAIKMQLDISDWFDSTHLNLMYLSAHTIQDSRKNVGLVSKISNFTLDSTFYSTLMKNNQKAYASARKFKKFAAKDAHNVPSYSLVQVKEMAIAMHDRMQDYRLTELAQDDQLRSARGRVEDMQIQFDIIEQQQEAYFSLELVQLEAMWAATDNEWNFNFDHRNAIENSIQTAMDAMMEESFKMRQEELQQMLEQAQQSIKSIEDIIQKYQKQVDRYLEQAHGSFLVQKDQFRKLVESKYKFRQELNLFKGAIHDWQEEQTLKAVVGFFSAIFSIFTGKIPNPGDIFDAGMLLIQLGKVWKMMDEINEMFNDLDLNQITDISMEPSTDFMTALDRAVDMKMKGPTFDEIKATADIKVNDMNEATNHEVKHTTEVMMALRSIADLGNRMIGEIGEFADNMLSLAERYDEIEVAEKDLKRAVEDVRYIETMIDDFEAEKKQFYKDREQARQEYQDEIDKMKEDYANMSAELREKYKQKIMEKFESFKLVFSKITDSYNDRMSFLIESIQQKSYGLKKQSMNQRIMIMVLYKDFCDAYFFHVFGKCSDSGMPFISDNFDGLLDALFKIQWDSITANVVFPGGARPQDFSGALDVKDDFEGLSYPIQIFKNESRLETNIRDLDIFNGFDDFWRIRIKGIRITLKDEKGQLIESPGEIGQFGGEIKVRITFPTIFIDESGDKEKLSFLGHHFFCNANYWAKPGQDPDVQYNTCAVDSEFSPSQYETSPNGLFTIEIKNPEIIRMQDIHSINVWFSGTYIPFLKKHRISV